MSGVILGGSEFGWVGVVGDVVDPVERKAQEVGWVL